MMLTAALVLTANATPPDLDTPLRTGAVSPADRGVVIGIADYVHLPDVKWADRDATMVRDFLVSTVGVAPERVTLLEGASREQIVAAVEAAGRDTRAGGVVWLYFAGHGVASPSTGHRLLLGDDTRQAPEAFDARGVELDALVDLAGAGGGKVFSWVDACFNGTDRDGAPVIADTRFAVPVWTLRGKAGAIGWSAAGPDQFARPLDAVQHGAFTWLSVGAMRGWADGEVDGIRDGAVSAAEASVFVDRNLDLLGLRDQDPVLVGDTAGWVLSPRATEGRAPDLSQALAAAPTYGPLPRPAQLNAGLAGDWDPGLVARADALQIHLPLRRGPDGSADVDGTPVSHRDVAQLARSSKQGKTGFLLRTLSFPAVGVGAGFLTACLAVQNYDNTGGWVYGTIGTTATVGSIVLAATGQTLLGDAVQPR